MTISEDLHFLSLNFINFFLKFDDFYVLKYLYYCIKLKAYRKGWSWACAFLATPIIDVLTEIRH